MMRIRMLDIIAQKPHFLVRCSLSVKLNARHCCSDTLLFSQEVSLAESASSA
jgi:hypothetical protein